jgi:hypothetical protein
MAEGVPVGGQKCHQNCLFEFAEHQRRQLLGGCVELLGKKTDQPPELLKPRGISVGGG